MISPIAWVLVDQSAIGSPASAPQDFGVTPITEEHGFSQTVRDVDLLAFSDDSPFELGVTPPPHHREDRHYELSIPFPFRPQSNAIPRFEECVDRDDLEQLLYGKRMVPAPAFPFHVDRQHTLAITPGAANDVLQVSVDTGTPAVVGQGFFYAKLALTYDEGFDKMCNPDICLTDPGRSCQATGESRLSYEWPKLGPALAGDLLLGPAGGTGVLGRLLGALRARSSTITW